jgi:hypothetical protein
LSWPYRYCLAQRAVKGDFIFEKSRLLKSWSPICNVTNYQVRWCAHLVGNINFLSIIYVQLIYSFMMSPRCSIVNIKYILLFVSIRGQMSRVYNDILVRKQSYALVYTVRDCIYMYIFIHNVNIFPYIIHSQHCSYDHEPWSPCPEKNMEKSGEKSGPKRSHIKLILIFSISFFG